MSGRADKPYELATERCPSIVLSYAATASEFLSRATGLRYPQCRARARAIVSWMRAMISSHATRRAP